MIARTISSNPRGKLATGDSRDGDVRRVICLKLSGRDSRRSSYGAVLLSHPYLVNLNLHGPSV
jgi:hypothetical protein